MLRTEPQVLLLDEPTRGIDINAKNEIYKLIDRLASEGRAVVVVSSEMPEIMALSDRILTLSAGRLTGTFNRNEFSEERLLKASLPTQ
jgi:ribose transport system ATP-binding protein